MSYSFLNRDLQKVIREGDLLTFKPHNVFGFVVALKTWHPVAHVEIGAEEGKTFASRFPDGVKKYDLETKFLNGIFRPVQALNMTAALNYFCLQAEGQKYDWKGLFGFYSVVKKGDQRKQFCSEFATNFYKAAGLNIFPNFESAEKIAPFELACANDFSCIWKSF